MRVEIEQPRYKGIDDEEDGRQDGQHSPGPFDIQHSIFFEDKYSTIAV